MIFLKKRKNNIMKLPERKHTRLKNYDYSQNGAYFVTICAAGRKQILSEIVGQAAPCLPQIKLTKIGKVTEKYIKNINNVYKHINVDKYVIMPDHIHIIFSINHPLGGGQRADRPTLNNIVRSIKVMVSKSIGYSVFQSSFFEHVIRNEDDLYETRKYIENNPLKWLITKTE